MNSQCTYVIAVLAVVDFNNTNELLAVIAFS